jgi:flagellar protein FliS
MAINAHAAYRETRIKTASPGQLVVMLYTEAVKQCDLALELMPEGGKVRPEHIERASNALIKAQDIVTELMASLDFDAGGDIAKSLFSLYTWFNRELVEANISKSRDRLRAVRDMLEELRGAWSIAATRANEGATAAVGVNIAG